MRSNTLAAVTFASAVLALGVAVAAARAQPPVAPHAPAAIESVARS